MNDAEELLRAALLKVPAGLAEHVVRVVDEALRLADVHGIDRQSVRIAALGHDLLRALNNERLLGIADDQAYAATDAVYATSLLDATRAQWAALATQVDMAALAATADSAVWGQMVQWMGG